ncbi:hypothetical protein GGS23DRAFT_89463 [Durotheca rogersii]|uniref:uncharacterized protein n=1 Tax=Durotheca rogersii TaxID=419775 RepID=UPI00221F1A13|nr:uncharacterized protein GGS23DRAFT_89463 [Durotheca rogersii]KAI5862720.1 hypothetical protein GGS23DRAFT_89463 [Durotheca rogersii]
MLGDGASDFQTALDALVRNYARSGQSFLPHYDLVRKVHEMRCLYRIWSHQKFFYQGSGPCLDELPGQIRQSLKRIAISRMKTREVDVLAQFRKALDSGLKPEERLPIWACMMQFILMYRSLFDLNQSEDLRGDPLQIRTVTTNLFSNLVVMCEISFGKKKPEAIADDGNPATGPIKRELNADFRRVESRRDEFYQSCSNDPRSCRLDHLLGVLLAGTQRGATRSGARAPKRARR